MDRPMEPRVTEEEQPDYFEHRPRTATEALVLGVLSEVVGTADGVGPSTVISSLLPSEEQHAELRAALLRTFQHGHRIDWTAGDSVAELADRFDATDLRSCVEYPVRVVPDSAGHVVDLFYVHSASGLAFAMAAANIPGIRAIGLRAAGMHGEQPIPRTIAEFASAYVAEIRRIQPRGPYRLGGFSAGGTIAHEMACQLQDLGETVDMLCVVDSALPGASIDTTRRQLMDDRRDELLRRVGYPEEERGVPAGEDGDRHAFDMMEAKGAFVPRTSAQDLTLRLDVYASLLTAVGRHRPRYFRGDIQYFSCTSEQDVVLGWQALGGRVHVYDIDAEHYEAEIFNHPAFSDIMTELAWRARAGGPAQDWTIPLSPWQRALWAGAAIGSHAPPPLSISLATNHDQATRLPGAVDELVRRHVALRSVVKTFGLGTPVVCAADPLTTDRPLPPTVRLEWTGASADSVTWTLRFDHIFCDAVSTDLIAEQLHALMRGAAPATDDQARKWEQDYLRAVITDVRRTRRIRRPARDHWRAALSHESVGDLVQVEPESARHRQSMSPSAVQALESAADEHGHGPFVARLGLVAGALSRLTGRPEVTIGLVLDQRVSAASGVVGCFISVAPLPVRVDPAWSFVELMDGVEDSFVGMSRFAALPLHEILASKKDDAGAYPAPDIVFNHVVTREGSLRMRGLADGAGFPVTVYSTEDPTAPVTIVSAADNMREARLRVWRQHLEGLAESVARTPLRPLKDIEVPGSTAATAPAVHYDDISRAIASGPTSGAVAAVTDEAGTWTYGALRIAATALGDELRRSGVSSGSWVGLHLPSGRHLVSAWTALLDMDAVGVPLPPSTGRAQADDAARALGCEWLVTCDTARTARRVRLTPLGRGDDRVSGRPSTTSDRPAYALTTSGSSGAPRALVGSREGLSEFISWHRTTFGFDGDDVVGAVTAPTFDVFLREILTPLSAGAHVVVGDPARSGDDVRRWVAEEGITVLHVVPSVARMWVETAHGSGETGLRVVFFAGEPLSFDDVTAWRRVFGSACRVVNLYGPSEMTLARTWFECLPDDEHTRSGPVPVGAPRPGSTVAVVSSEGRLSGPDEVGQIVMRAQHPSLGYLSSDGGWSPLPSLSLPGHGAFYPTGDRGRWNPKGQLVVLGRLDGQTKVRGIRVDVDAVTGVLRGCPDVGDAAVLAYPEQRPTDLVAVVVPQAEGEDPAELVNRLLGYLAGRLQRDHVPSRILIRDALPLTARGKLDRRSLRALIGQRALERDTQPLSHEQGVVADHWQAVLGHHDFGADDDFFRCGGDSLKIVRLANALGRAVGKEMRPSDLYRAPTIRMQACLLGDDATVPAGMTLEEG